jgi:hypothetical protein
VGDLAKSLFLQAATASPGPPPVRRRLFGPSRASAALALPLFRWFGCDFFRVPTAASVSSVVNSLLTFGSARGLHARFDLLELSLLLMLCIGADFSGVSDEAVFPPTHRPLDRGYGELEARAYVMPFFSTFWSCGMRILPLANAQMLGNALHLAGFVSATEYTPVILRVLGHLVCLPGLASVLHSGYRAYASAVPAHLGPWIVVSAQVAVQVAAIRALHRGRSHGGFPVQGVHVPALIPNVFPPRTYKYRVLGLQKGTPGVNPWRSPR